MHNKIQAEQQKAGNMHLGIGMVA